MKKHIFIIFLLIFKSLETKIPTFKLYDVEIYELSTELTRIKKCTCSLLKLFFQRNICCCYDLSTELLYNNETMHLESHFFIYNFFSKKGLLKEVNLFKKENIKSFFTSLSFNSSTMNIFYDMPLEINHPLFNLSSDRGTIDLHNNMTTLHNVTTEIKLSSSNH